VLGQFDHQILAVQAGLPGQGLQLSYLAGQQHPRREVDEQPARQPLAGEAGQGLAQAQ